VYGCVCVWVGIRRRRTAVAVWTTSLQLITTPVLLLCSASRRFSIYVRSRSVPSCRTVGEAIRIVLVQPFALYFRRTDSRFHVSNDLFKFFFVLPPDDTQLRSSAAETISLQFELYYIIDFFFVQRFFSHFIYND